MHDTVESQLEVCGWLLGVGTIDQLDPCSVSTSGFWLVVPFHDPTAVHEPTDGHETPLRLDE